MTTHLKTRLNHILILYQKTQSKKSQNSPKLAMVSNVFVLCNITWYLHTIAGHMIQHLWATLNQNFWNQTVQLISRHNVSNRLFHCTWRFVTWNSYFSLSMKTLCIEVSIPIKLSRSMKKIQNATQRIEKCKCWKKR